MKKSAAMRLLVSVCFGKSGDFYGELLSKGLISPSFSCWCQHNALFSFVSLSGDSEDPDRVFEGIYRLSCADNGKASPAR